ncbi:hypothetical protein BC2230_80032 [Burkholderia cepacia]
MRNDRSGSIGKHREAIRDGKRVRNYRFPVTGPVRFSLRVEAWLERRSLRVQRHRMTPMFQMREIG